MPGKVPYVELHASSAFSFLRGGSSPEALMARAVDLGLSGLAVCDRGGFYGSPRCEFSARALSIRALVGAELVFGDGSVLPVLVRDGEGYANLSRLLTKVHLGGSKGEGRVCWDDLKGRTAGMIALSGGRDGPLYRAWASGDAKRLEQTIQSLERTFGRDSRFAEVQRHQRRGERRYEQWLASMAKERGWKIVATNGVLYATAAERMVADVFTCLRHRTTLDRAGLLLEANDERRLKSPKAMQALFSDHPEWVANTAAIAAEMDFSIRNPGYRFPSFPVPRGETIDSFLRKLTWFGAEQRYGSLGSEVRNQLERELTLIAKLGFSGYFLIVWDIINFCREHGIMVQGRGSAANSAVCYSLGITAVDPVGHRLLFERFLSEGRQGWPDIDLDLPSGQDRERVIQEVYRRYGRRGAAMTANVITYRGRSAVREITKVLGFDRERADRFSELAGGGDFPETIALRERLIQSGIKPDQGRGKVLLELLPRMIGLPRHLGQHSGGMIICEGMLDAVVPLEPASMKGRVVAQWDKDDCEELGIIKVDLLGLGMMAALQESLQWAHRRGHPIDLAKIPKDDTKTYDLLCSADTVGVFQVESRAQMATLPRMQPRCFYDLVVEVAIIRPGPIVGRLAHPYLERRCGRQPVRYSDPRLQPILERTLGVPLFQEQVLKMAMELAGFSGAEAEELRKAMSFKRSDERMRRVQEKLRGAMSRRKVSPEVMEEMIEAIGSFALYGFPESHAISFALLAYASAYLKANYPAEFFTGLLNHQPMGFYSSATLIQDGRRHGLRFLPSCVQRSEGDCSIVDDHTIRLGLNYVRGLSRVARESIFSARKEKGFSSLDDFRSRTGLSVDALRLLAESGALNPLTGHRRKALWMVEDKSNGPDDLWSHSMGEEPDADDPCPLPPMSLSEKVGADLRCTGLTVGAHPMALLREELSNSWKASDLRQAEHGLRVEVSGAVTCRQRPGTAKGVFFVSLEDETGVANVVVYPGLFEARRWCLLSEPFLSVKGRVQHLEGTISVLADTVEPLSTNLPAQGSHDFR